MLYLRFVNTSNDLHLAESIPIFSCVEEGYQIHVFSSQGQIHTLTNKPQTGFRQGYKAHMHMPFFCPHTFSFLLTPTFMSMRETIRFETVSFFQSVSCDPSGHVCRKQIKFEMVDWVFQDAVARVWRYGWS